MDKDLTRDIFHKKRQALYERLALNANVNTLTQARKKKIGSETFRYFVFGNLKKAGIDFSEIEKVHEKDNKEGRMKFPTLVKDMKLKAIEKGKNTDSQVLKIRKLESTFKSNKQSGGKALICNWIADLIDMHTIFESGNGMNASVFDKQTGFGNNIFKTEFNCSDSSIGQYEVHHHFSWIPNDNCLLYASGIVSLDGTYALYADGTCGLDNSAFFSINQHLLVTQIADSTVGAVSAVSPNINVGFGSVEGGCSYAQASGFINDLDEIDHAIPAPVYIAKNEAVDITLVTNILVSVFSDGLANISLGSEDHLGLKVYAVFLTVEYL
jgi:hypothetical protein